MSKKTRSASPVVAQPVVEPAQEAAPVAAPQAPLPAPAAPVVVVGGMQLSGPQTAPQAPQTPSWGVTLPQLPGVVALGVARPLGVATVAAKRAEPRPAGEAPARYSWEGIPVTQVLRFLGSKRVGPVPASKAVTALGMPCAMATVKTQVQLGHKPGAKLPALTAEQEARLLAAAGR